MSSEASRFALPEWQPANSLTWLARGTDNLCGCWSSPLTALWADDSYEKQEFLGRSTCVPTNPSNQEKESARELCVPAAWFMADEA